MKAMSSPRSVTGAGSPPSARQVPRRHHPAQAGHAGLQQARHAQGLGHRDQQHRLRVVQDAGVAQHMVFELRRARRRIDRHRDRPRLQDAEVDAEVVGRGRQHDRHALARLDAGPLQAGGKRRRGVGELAVAEGLLGVVLQQHDLRLVGVGLHDASRAPRAACSPRPGRRPMAAAPAGVACGAGSSSATRGAGRGPAGAAAHLATACSRSATVSARCSVSCGSSTPNSRSVRSTQLHARQAVEPEVAVELAVQRHRPASPAVPALRSRSAASTSASSLSASVAGA